jgi:hypothetical protein
MNAIEAALLDVVGPGAVAAATIAAAHVAEVEGKIAAHDAAILGGCPGLSILPLTNCPNGCTDIIGIAHMAA